ncbi:hypothetical protein [Streptomyces sp. NPDC098781]|uniref:hypothetical protein n=1 Tax=Streptomyces sp. NPDC098781 TaxID=3366097 RepID=UPI0038287735
MKIIATGALAGAALLTAVVPASADDGPVDFGIFQGVNDTKSSSSRGPHAAWGQSGGESNGTVPKSPLASLLGLGQ